MLIDGLRGLRILFVSLLDLFALRDVQRSLGWKRVTPHGLPHGPPRGQRATPRGRSTSSRWEWKRRSSTKNRKNKVRRELRVMKLFVLSDAHTCPATSTLDLSKALDPTAGESE